jgi:hypothetical protein
MQFLNDIRQYVEQFGSEANDEVHRFLDFVKDKYEAMQPRDAVVAPPTDAATQAFLDDVPHEQFDEDGADTAVSDTDTANQASDAVDPAPTDNADPVQADIAPSTEADPVPAAPVADGSTVVDNTSATSI